MLNEILVIVVAAVIMYPNGPSGAPIIIPNTGNGQSFECESQNCQTGLAIMGIIVIGLMVVFGIWIFWITR